MSAALKDTGPEPCLSQQTTNTPLISSANLSSPCECLNNPTISQKGSWNSCRVNPSAWQYAPDFQANCQAGDKPLPYPAITRLRGQDQGSLPQGRCSGSTSLVASSSAHPTLPTTQTTATNHPALLPAYPSAVGSAPPPSVRNADSSGSSAPPLSDQGQNSSSPFGLTWPSEKLPQCNGRRQGPCQVVILEEVLSWRRTPCQSQICRRPCIERQKPYVPFSFSQFKRNNASSRLASLLAVCLILMLSSSRVLVMASEFPDRECCDNPLYKFDPPGGQGRQTSFRPPLQTFAPPEVPDYPESPHLEVPDHRPGSGGMMTTPAGGSLGCLLSRTLCTEDSACNQILQVIPRVCGLELVACSTPTVTKCQAALRTLQSFPFFKPTCLCKEPRLDPDCNQFKDFLVDHPCLNAKYKEPDRFPVDALATCDHAQEICQEDQTCSQRVRTFTSSCPVKRDRCVMTDVPSCHSSWQNLRQSPIFGCFCPTNMRNKQSCDRIFKIVNANDCIDAQLPDTLRVTYTNLAKAAQFWNLWYQNLGSGVSGVGRTTRHTVSVDEPPNQTSTPYNLPTTVDRQLGGDHEITKTQTQKDQEIVNLRSTCHLAMDSCERDANCRPFLEQVKSKCVETCNRDRCMAAVKDFYRRIPRQHSLDIAFCLCKKHGDDDQCFRAQAVLHPSCAQDPEKWTGNEDDLPSCHSRARNCRNNKSCRLKLERYEQACSVDGETKTCAGTYTNCREAMVEILGTDLRTNCACTGAAGDFRELFECIEYKRLFFVNPCVVDAQKDYHLRAGGVTPKWQPEISLPPARTPARTPAPRPPPSVRRTTSPRRTRRPSTARPTTKKREIELIPTVTEEISTSTTSTTTTSTTTTSSTEAPTTPSRRTKGVIIGTKPWTPLTPPPRTTRQTRRPKIKKTTKGVTDGINTTTATTLPPKYCSLFKTEWQDENVKYIREGFEKRLYPDAKDDSYLCGCVEGSVLKCTMLTPITKKPCNTENAFYSHASPFYMAYRGQCLCYSGEFICAKHDIHKGVKTKTKMPVPESPPGVFLYLGYSKKDMVYLTSARNEIQDKKHIPSTEEEEKDEVKNTIQQTVSHFTSNMNKTDCRISLVDRIGENYILKATLDEFDNFRQKKNMSNFMKYKEKEECFAALESIAQKVNDRDSDMQSHVVLSMFKVAAAEANVPDPPPSGCSRLQSSLDALVFGILLLIFLQCPRTPS